MAEFVWSCVVFLIAITAISKKELNRQDILTFLFITSYFLIYFYLGNSVLDGLRIGQLFIFLPLALITCLIFPTLITNYPEKFIIAVSWSVLILVLSMLLILKLNYW